MRRIFVLAISLTVQVVFFQIASGHVIKEASGIIRHNDDLLIVSDDDPGAYYRYPLNGQTKPLIRIEPNHVTKVEIPNAIFALDLESIDVLRDGSKVVLSERLRSLIGEQGLIVAEYSNTLSEFGNRGLEGLAVCKHNDCPSDIAVLWEGGYPDYYAVPSQLRPYVGKLPMRPVVWMHNLKDKKVIVEIKKKTEKEYSLEKIELDLPKPEVGFEPNAQRFRAPDLVWHKIDDKNWGFIVLLNSENSPDDGSKTEHSKYIWLQRFTIDGIPVGVPIEINNYVSSDLNPANWEGLAWFEEGKSLVLVYDKYPKKIKTPVALVICPDWESGEAFSHIVHNETEYYLLDPQQARQPEGRLSAGTKVYVIRESRSYSLVQMNDGSEAFVASADLRAGCLD